MPGKGRLGAVCTTLATKHFWGAFDARSGRHGWASFEGDAMFEFKGMALFYSSSLLCCCVAAIIPPCLNTGMYQQVAVQDQPADWAAYYSLRGIPFHSLIGASYSLSTDKSLRLAM